MRLLKEIRTLMDNYHLKSGIYHYYRNEFKQAVDFLRKALRDDPKMTDSERQTAVYYLTETFVTSAERLVDRGELTAAAQDFARAVEVNPRYPDIRYRYGKCLEALARSDEAAEQYRRAIDRNPDYLEARVALAFCLMRAGKLAEADEAYEAALTLKIRKLRAPCERGRQRLGEGDVERAEAWFRQAFLGAPDRFEHHYRSGLAFLKAEEYEKALIELDAALEINPGYADLHNFRGIALCETGRLDEGMDAFRRSFELNGGFLLPKLNLGFAQLRAGRFKDAEAQLAEVLEEDPTVHAAAVKLEELRTGRFPEARRAAARGNPSS